MTIDNATPTLRADDNDTPNSITNNVSSQPNTYTIPNIINGAAIISKTAIVLGFMLKPH